MKNRIKAAARFAMRLTAKLRLLWIFPGNPKVLQMHGGTTPAQNRRLCIFASFSRTGRVEEYVTYNLKALQDMGFDIVFVTTSHIMREDDLRRLQGMCVRVVLRANTGYDFGSWKAGLFYSGIDYLKYDQLLLTNDSYYGPLYPWSEILSQARTDLYGITDSYGIAYHLMSYFVLYNKNVLHSTEFRSYWQGVRMVPTLLKTLIIYAYEVGMSQQFQKAGYAISAWCPERVLFQHLPQEQHLFGQTITVHYYWRELIELMRCPILKTDTFWRVFQGKATWRPVVQQTGYDNRLIDQHQANLKNARKVR